MCAFGPWSGGERARRMSCLDVIIRSLVLVMKGLNHVDAAQPPRVSAVYSVRSHARTQRNGLKLAHFFLRRSRLSHPPAAVLSLSARPPPGQSGVRAAPHLAGRAAWWLRLPAPASSLRDRVRCKAPHRHRVTPCTTSTLQLARAQSPRRPSHARLAAAGPCRRPLSEVLRRRSLTAAHQRPSAARRAGSWHCSCPPSCTRPRR